MMFLFLAAGLVMISGALFADQGTGSRPSGPNIPLADLQETHFRFGTVKEGTEINHAFIIANKGQAPLRIEKVKSGCGCTTVDYTSEIQPNAEGRIVIKANTSGYHGREFSKTIQVETNDPKNKILTLLITGLIN